MTECPKCGETSGNSWEQCEGWCPLPASPHYDPKLQPVTQHDNHVRMMRAHASYFALAGCCTMKEADHLALKASIAGLSGDLDLCLTLMHEAQAKANEYGKHIRNQLHSMNPRLKYEDDFGFKTRTYLKAVFARVAKRTAA